MGTLIANARKKAIHSHFCASNGALKCSVMNRISASMVHDISFIDDEFPDIYLSSVGANFVNGNPVGCANGLNISDIKENMLADAKCNCINRDHQYSVSKQKTKRGYKISYPKQNYQLKEGL